MSTPETYAIQNTSSYNQTRKTRLPKISTYLRFTSYNIHEKIKLTFKKDNYQPLTLSQKATDPCEDHIMNLDLHANYKNIKCHKSKNKMKSKNNYSLVSFVGIQPKKKSILA